MIKLMAVRGGEGVGEYKARKTLTVDGGKKRKGNT